MIIKGQNLRLFDISSPSGDKVIAMSTNCTVHIALQLEQFSTKDDIDDWVRQQPVGQAWDCSVDALVPGVTSGRAATSLDAGTYAGVAYYGTGTITLPSGKRIVAALIDNDTPDGIYITNTPPISGAGDILNGGTRKVEYINAGSSSKTVTICSKEDDAPVVYFIADADALTLEDLEIGQKIKLAFATAEANADDMNRAMGEGLLTGTAIINDISINSTNRQNVTYALQMQGDGMLTRMSN